MLSAVDVLVSAYVADLRGFGTKVNDGHDQVRSPSAQLKASSQPWELALSWQNPLGEFRGRSRVAWGTVPGPKAQLFDRPRVSNGVVGCRSRRRVPSQLPVELAPWCQQFPAAMHPGVALLARRHQTVQGRQIGVALADWVQVMHQRRRTDDALGLTWPAQGFGPQHIGPQPLPRPGVATLS